MRILFEKNQQKIFIENVCKKLHKNLKELNYELNKANKISYSALKKYRHEDLLLSEEIANYLSKISKVNWKKLKYKKMLPEKDRQQQQL